MKNRVDVKKPLQPKTPQPSAPEPAPPAEPAPADKTNDAGKEAQPRQPDSLAGWSLGDAFPEWGPLDLTGGGSKLPKPGTYDAVISDLTLIDKSDRQWAIVDFRLDGLDASPAPMWALLASHNTRSDRHKLADGARVLRRLAAATLTPLEAMNDAFDLPGLFIGKPVKLTLAHKTLDGVNELVVRAIMPH